MRRAVIELVLAAVALAGCVVCWVAARSDQLAPAVTAGEPEMPSVAYDPPLIALSLVLATVAGVLAVVGIGRVRAVR